MRDLKFRIWSTHEKRWLCEDSQYLVMDGSEILAAPWSTISFKMPSQDYVVEQYTGLKDKNGREIYEGDIVHETWDSEYPYSYCPEAVVKNSRIVRISYNAPSFNLKNEAGDSGEYCVEDFQIEIIGNIHENPELLPPANQ